MIRDFVESWDLFSRAYATGWVAAALLSVLGVFLVARDRVFLGAVMGEAAACGVAVVGALGLVSHDAHALGATLFAASTVPLAAARRPGSTTMGVLFVAFGAVAIVAASKNPHGMEEVQQLLTSSLLGASDEHLEILAGLSVVLVAAAILLRGRILFCIVDPDAAAVAGKRPGLVILLLSFAWAVAAGITIHAAGLVFAFGMLVLPAAVTRSLFRGFLATLLAAPAVALIATTVAYVLALHWDLPPGPSAVALLAPLVPLARLARLARARHKR